MKTINKLDIRKLLYFSFFIITLLVVGFISKSYSIYKLEQKYNLIESKIINYTSGDVEVAVLVDGKESASFPTYEDNYLVTEINCTNGATASWDVLNWRIAIDDMSVTSTKCTVSFDSTKKNEITPVNMTKTELIALNEEITNTSAKQLANYLYPVGSVYLSTEDDTIEKVQDKFGGTWVKYGEDMTLVGASSTKAVNTTGGSSTSILSTNNLPAHTHSVTASGSVSSSFSGSQVNTNNTGGHSHTASCSTGATGNHSHTASVPYKLTNEHNGTTKVTGETIAGGSGDAYGNRAIVFNAIPTITTNTTGNHSHTCSASTGSAGGHAHTVTASGSVSSSFTGTAVNSSSVGSGEAFSVQNPYVAVYMYKRTA